MLRLNRGLGHIAGGTADRGVIPKFARALTARRDESGAAAAEFALIFPVLILLILGMIQYGWFFYVSQSSSSGAREAARRIVVGDCRGSGEAQNYARAQASISSLTLTWGAPNGASGVSVLGSNPGVGDVIRVKVQANGKILGFLPMPDGGQVTRIVDSRNEDNNADGPCS